MAITDHQSLRVDSDFFPHISLSIDNQCKAHTTLAGLRKSIPIGRRLLKSAGLVRVHTQPRVFVLFAPRSTGNA